MAFPSEQSANPFGGPPSYIHQLRKGSVPIDPGPGPPKASSVIPGKTTQHYGQMTMIPSPIVSMVMKTIESHFENIESNEALKHIELARSHANNPNLFKYHMGEAERYKQVAHSKNINDLIRNKLSDSELDKIDGQIAALRRGKLSNPDVMRQLQQLQIERNRRKDILMQNEVQAYNNYLTNPFSSMNEKPQTLPENHAQRSLQQFLQTHHGVVTPNARGHLIIDGKKISEDPHDVPRLVHYLTKDISGPPPTGVKEMIEAMRRRGFDVQNDLGNTYLKHQLRLEQRQASLSHDRRQKIMTSQTARRSRISRKPYDHSTPTTTRTTPLVPPSFHTPPSSSRSSSSFGPDDDDDDDDFTTPRGSSRMRTTPDTLAHHTTPTSRGSSSAPARPTRIPQPTAKTPAARPRRSSGYGSYISPYSKTMTFRESMQKYVKSPSLLYAKRPATPKQGYDPLFYHPSPRPPSIPSPAETRSRRRAKIAKGEIPPYFPSLQTPHRKKRK